MAMVGPVTKLWPLIQRSLAPATWAAYSKVWQEWFFLEQELGLEGSEEARQELFFVFLGRLLEKGMSPAGIDRQLAGLVFLCKMAGWRDFTKLFVVRQALKGWRKEHASVDWRRPISWEILKGLVAQLPSLCTSPYEAVLFRTAFVLAFYGALRVGELVSQTTSQPGGLLEEDVVLVDGEVQVCIRSSKTDQLGRGAWLSLFSLPGCSSCPVQATREYMAVRQGKGGAFLRHEDGSSLSRYQFVAVVRKCLGAMGLSPGEYGAHSFRIGAATEAVRLGLSVDTVQRIGRWESQRYRSYVRPGMVETLR